MSAFDDIERAYVDEYEKLTEALAATRKLNQLLQARCEQLLKKGVNRAILCDTCQQEIKPGTNGCGVYGGLLTWDVQNGKGAKNFLVVHKNMDGYRCDPDDDRFSMELDVAVGPHGLARLIFFLTEPETDRPQLFTLIMRLYFTNGELNPPRTAYDRRCADKLWGYE